VSGVALLKHISCRLLYDIKAQEQSCTPVVSKGVRCEFVEGIVTCFAFTKRYFSSAFVIQPNRRVEMNDESEKKC
jgi:hypothetical protein